MHSTISEPPGRLDKICLLIEVHVQDPASLAFSPPRRSRRTLEESIMYLELGVALHPVEVSTTKGKEE